MEKDKNIVGLSRELIIHPGETLAEVLEDREMSQRELAIRTGVTEKHISTIIHGQKNISAAFAKKLEYALGIEAAFWMNLQASYDRELLEFEEVDNISEEELGVLKNLKEVIPAWTAFGWLEKEANAAARVLDFRKIFGVSNLLAVPKISYSAAYRVQLKNTNVDPYVLFAWQRMCELLTKNAKVADEVDVEKLRTRIPDIRSTMFFNGNQITERLAAIFADCGIAFRIVPNFSGAPVQGFIKKSEDGVLMLCVTLRQKFADIFWFTVFHEIAHILNGDVKQIFVDFESVLGNVEARADKMACDFLLAPDAYMRFVATEEYMHIDGIERFAEEQKVKDYIVRGRLMKEGRIPWGSRPRYEWANPSGAG